MAILPSTTAPPVQSHASFNRLCVVLLGLSACIASLALYALPIARPILVVDDFQITFRSWTWLAAWENLWVPANEHAMPLGRISTAVLVTLAQGRPTAYLALCGWHGPLALVLGMILVGLFVGRERGNAFFGLLAMALFGVSTVYQQAVYWFSSSFSILALDTFLLALLAAQSAVKTGRRWPLALSFLGCALAPGWFAIGILAGPLCSLYFFAALCESRGSADERGAFSISRLQFPWDYLKAVVPLFGSVAFLAVSLPLTARTIMHLHHYGDETAVEAFKPSIGLLYSCRAVVDHLAWGTIGVSELICPQPWVWAAFGVLMVVASVWMWLAPRKSLVVLGAGAIGASYLLVYSARAEWQYEKMAWWSRYHLLPQLGLVFLIVGGLRVPRRLGPSEPGSRVTFRQCILLCIVIGLLLLLQAPRGILAHVRLLEEEDKASDFISTLPGGRRVSWRDAEIHAEQMRAFRRIEAVDALCREHHISVEDAMRALAPISIPQDAAGDPQKENNWQFLRGSDQPREKSDEDIRGLLEPAVSD